MAEVQMRDLVERGVAVIEGAVAASDCDRIVGEWNAFTADNAAYFDPLRNEHGLLRRVVNAHVACRALLPLFVANERVLRLADRFFDAETVLYTSLLYEEGSSQAIHRDSPYFATRPDGRYLGVWVALEDADASNGCLEVIRGGHAKPFVDPVDVARRYHPDPSTIPSSSQELWDDYQGRVEAACLESGLVRERVQVRKGDVIVWHPSLPHGGSTIGSPGRSRYSFVMHVVPRDTAVYHQDVFFDPDKVVPATMSWSYGESRGRRFIEHESIDVEHRAARAVRDLVHRSNASRGNDGLSAR